MAIVHLMALQLIPLFSFLFRKCRSFLEYLSCVGVDSRVLQVCYKLLSVFSLLGLRKTFIGCKGIFKDSRNT